MEIDNRGPPQVQKLRLMMSEGNFSSFLEDPSQLELSESPGIPLESFDKSWLLISEGNEKSRMW